MVNAQNLSASFPGARPADRLAIKEIFRQIFETNNTLEHGIRGTTAREDYRQAITDSISQMPPCFRQRHSRDPNGCIRDLMILGYKLRPGLKKRNHEQETDKAQHQDDIDPLRNKVMSNIATFNGRRYVVNTSQCMVPLSVEKRLARDRLDFGLFTRVLRQVAGYNPEEHEISWRVAEDEARKCVIAGPNTWITALLEMQRGKIEFMLDYRLDYLKLKT
ncbi:hypothetical protein BDV25DRAFT_142858 [Aspergillus avenaceus]|uniref:Uncharacterized protein n=1 Tax=Aspergillus avenaceus TaxID=36643 RepID=A0A5N6TLT2_ASPAV|nr:hypothetical protein BDV25DRAFT_142858 [Aspergillus avenaceus]